MTYQTAVGAITIGDGITTTVDCHKQVRSWRLLRSLIELLIPTCNCTYVLDEETKQQQQSYLKPDTLPSSKVMIGTIFGYPRGKANLCIQTSSNSENPYLLLELAFPTTVLAREMQGGVLRIALNQCSNAGYSNSNYLFSMHCNGRFVGYAIQRSASKVDIETLRLMRSVHSGAGVISTGKQLGQADQDGSKLMYLRANFKRMGGSRDSESFHLIDPYESIDQELSIFFFRSR